MAQQQTSSDKPAPAPKKRTIRGVKHEVIRRYKDERGQTWLVVKAPMFPDTRPGARPVDPNRFIERHIPDPDVKQPRPGRQAVTALEV